jgi:NMD protein affecting ribosome stability and mRNA decay
MDKGNFGRRDRLVKEKQHDTYKQRKKRTEPTICPECKSVFIGGRWTWNDAPDDALTETCPACMRIADNYPAGYVEFKGPFFELRREEIMNLVNNEEKMEKGEHPMERIMAISPQDDLTLITTTGVHIARRLGEAVSRAYQGDLSFTYSDNENTIRVQWVSKDIQ